MATEDVGTYLLVDIQVITQTGKAVLVRSMEFNDEFWIPQSQIHEDSDVWKTGQEGDMLVTEWLAIQKGWL